MKKILLPILCLGTILGIAPAYAQPVLECQVPFDFNIGPTTLSAGKYRVTFPTQGAIMVRNESTREGAITLTTAEMQSQKRIGEHSRLVFTRYAGDQYYLAEVWTQGHEFGSVLKKSRKEVMVAVRTPRNSREQIMIASR